MAEDDELPNIPLIGPARPWINLVHRVGLPWVLIVGAVYYGYPLAKDTLEVAKQVREQQEATNKRMDSLDSQATKAMPLLEEATKAIPLLQSIHEATRAGAKQRHEDIQNLRSEVNSVKKDAIQ